MEKIHILIVGERHIGKSTLIQRLLRHTRRPVCGFITKSLPLDETGFHPVYIHPAAQKEDQRTYTPENLIAAGDMRVNRVNRAAFDTLGVEHLSNLPQDGIVVMDELGFMEASSEAFTSKVLETLDGEIPVLAAVKTRTDISFLNAVRTHPNAQVFTLTEENRNSLFDMLLPIVQSL